MKCPKCGREMQGGYLQCNSKSVIVWVNNLLPFNLSYWKTDAEPVSKELKLGTSAIPTHICKHCKLLVGDYNN